jgi:G3E family GTPase
MGRIEDQSDTGLQELMRAVLMRANFVPAVRHVLGWRGIRFARTSTDAWTARIKGFAGVFGMQFAGLLPALEWVRGEFEVFYFPDPDEELVERCPLRAAAAVQQDDYRQRVRHFQAHPDFSDLFAVGRVGLALDAPRSALGLSLESANRLRSVALEGVRLPQGDRVVEVIPPGGRDQDFPAFDVAMAFFDVLAASATFNLEECPVLLRDRRFPGTETVFDGQGAARRVPAEDIWLRRLDLGYGAAGTALLGALGDEGRYPIPRGDFLWTTSDGNPPFAERAWWRAHRLENVKGVDRKFLGVDERPALIVLTGFLGAGKTSFLQRFIEYQTQRHRFVAVIQNEIGATGLDGRLLEDNFTAVEIDEGCVCCTLAGNLKSAITQILARFQPDTIVVETTGVANPANLLDELVALEEVVRFDSVATVVDAANFANCLASAQVAADQVRSADILLVNKTDLVPADRLPELEASLRRLNPRAAVIFCRHGDVNPGLLFGVDTLIGGDPVPHAGPKAVSGAPRATHLQDHIENLKISLPSPLDRARFLEAVGRRLPAGVFRIKGLVAFSDRQRPELFQYVGGRYEISDVSPSEGESNFLIVIGRHLDPQALNTLFASVLAGEAPRPAQKPPQR